MFKTLSFRGKIFVSQLILFVIFVAMLPPFVEKTASDIVQKSFVENALEFINVLKISHSPDDLFKRLQDQDVLFHFNLYDSQGKELYDSHTIFQRTLNPSTEPDPEVTKALKDGFAYGERFSKTFGIKFVYLTFAFRSHQQVYVLRTAYPYAQVEDLIYNFFIGFLIIGSGLLLSFMLITWLIFARVSRPIDQIIQTINLYHEGKVEELPHIQLGKEVDRHNDLRHLAETLNSLSDRIQSQIQSIRQERNEKESIIESLGEGVMAVNKQLHVQYVNFIGAKMLGFSKRQLIGSPIGELIRAAKRPLLEHCRQLLATCQQQNKTITDSIAIGDKRKVYLEIIATPKLDKHGAILVIQDNSNHYRVLEMGKDFVANASHELRTPITIIRGFAETILDLPEVSQEMLHDIIEKIVRNCQRMDNLVKNLLTLADIENLPLPNVQKYNLVDLVEECGNNLLSIYPHVDLKIHHTQQKIMANVAPDLLELAISNLLQNAVKYSTPPAHITLEIGQEEDEIKIVISDRGIGIPEGDIEHIFNRFYTVNKAHSRKLGGAGLGLSIVKTIIEKHDGAISVTSKLGEGSTFTITLPLP